MITPLDRLLKEKAAAQQRLKRAQDAFAKLEAKEKKIETRFKLKLGDWLLTACKAAKKSAFNEVVVLSSRIDQPIPDEISAWLDQLDRAEEAKKKAEEEAKNKKK